MEYREGQKFTATVNILWHRDSEYKDESGWSAKSTQDRTELSNLLSSAQQFIIEKSNKQVAFDIIEISVQGEDCVDVTVIDLPGIVRSIGKDETASLITDINLLINSFLINDRCVILAVVPANVDFHNSQILADAEKVDPSTSRTIPVITKPDMIDPGGERGVLDLLEGRKKTFAMGFHMVKCRGQKALNNKVTLEQAFDEEKHFFSSVDPWRNVASDIVGVSSLRLKLAEIQVSMLEKFIPSIKKEIIDRLVKAEADLAKLGETLQTDSTRRKF